MRFVLIFLLVFTLYADDHIKHTKHHINKELSHLDLTYQQNKKVKKILKEFRHQLKEYKKLEEEIEERRKAFFTSETLDTDKLDMLNIQLDAKAHSIENEFLRKMHAILTPEQRKKFVDYFDDWEVE